jgi:hypothetical protein
MASEASKNLDKWRSEQMRKTEGLSSRPYHEPSGMNAGGFPSPQSEARKRINEEYERRRRAIPFGER